jgi:hypothetical protein
MLVEDKLVDTSNEIAPQIKKKCVDDIDTKNNDY